MYLIQLSLGLLLIALAGCGSEQKTGEPEAENRKDTIMEQPVTALHITSSAFAPNGPIPKQYTCDGDNHSPELTWENVPEKTRSLVLICDDPDAPHKTWVHWVLYNIPPDVTTLPEGIAAEEIAKLGITAGRNDFGAAAYGGPCPPSGVHHYHFKLFALDTTLPLQPGAEKPAVEEAMARHIIAATELVGTYSR